MSDFDDLVDSIGAPLRTACAPTIEGYARRLAEIEDELESRGCNALLDEKELIRTELKKLMAMEQQLEYKDEETGYVATATPSYRDVWDTNKLEKALTKTQRSLCIIRSVDTRAVAQLVKVGALSRATLETVGAVTKQLITVSLRFGKPKEEK